MGSLIRGMRLRACVPRREFHIFPLQHAMTAERSLKTGFLKQRESRRFKQSRVEISSKQGRNRVFPEIVSSPSASTIQFNNLLRFTGESGCFRYAERRVKTTRPILIDFTSRKWGQVMSVQEHPVDTVERMIAAVQQGEHSQLGVLLNLYRGYLLTIAGHELGSDVVAKAAPSDLVQETFLEASQAFAQFRGTTEPELRAWLNQILSRNLIDLHRHYRDFSKRNISREVSFEGRFGGPSLSLAAAVDPPSKQAQTAENLKLLQAGFKTLNEEQRQAVQLRSVEQLDFEEVGQRLGRTADAARKLWARAIQKLAMELQSDDARSARPR